MSEPLRQTQLPPRATSTQEIASRYVSDANHPTAAEVRALVHALEVHEMELLAQNDQLQATRQDMELSRGRNQQACDSAQEATKKASAELVRSKRDLQQFANVASHDLAAPLRMVTGFLGLLQERYAPQLDETAREFIGFAVDGAQRMERLLHGLLTYARVGSRGGEFLPFELTAVLEHVLRERMVAIDQSGAAITWDPLPPVTADEGQVGQLLSHLIENAITYRAKGRGLKIHVGARRQDGAWVISVGDNGIGFDPKSAERIFEIFQCLHTQGEYEGTGMGLAICKRIVERHGGRIWAESQPGQGATFFFTIPDRR